MTEPSNKDRSRRAELTLIAYAALERRTDELAGSGAVETLLSDLLADFMHFAWLMNIDYQNCADVAGMHFRAEIAEAT